MAPIAFWARRLLLTLNDAEMTKFGPVMLAPMKPTRPTFDYVLSTHRSTPPHRWHPARASGNRAGLA
jgi:hypothetical protein